MIHVSDLYGIAMADITAVGCLDTHQHFKERGLARPVGADDADDAARRQRERKIIDQQFVSKSLAQIFYLDDFVAQARPGRNVDLVGFAA